MKMPSKEELVKIYGDAEKSEERFKSLAAGFEKVYGKDNMEFFTAPGRTEVIGNHTDHNGGKILAASITLDTIGAACPNGTDIVRIVSEGYEGMIEINVKEYAAVEKCAGTKSLVAGMLEAIAQKGFQAAGFDAYISTNVISAAGVSSSASFEMLICAMINYFFNDSKIQYADYARIGQYAENHYWLKSSGLMDQMACAAGGAIVLDFADGVKCEKIDFSLDKFGYELVIVNTGAMHCDLSDAYSEIPQEMKAVAKAMGKELLCDCSFDAFCEQVPALQKTLQNDRAIMRALHFFTENQRVVAAVKAVEENDSKTLLQVIKASGDSSWKWLQNCYVATQPEEEKCALVLAMTELFLQKINDGCCRIHGGGFAGVIACIVPKAYKAEYVTYIEKVVGENNVYPMTIRQVGAVHIQ